MLEEVGHTEKRKIKRGQEWPPNGQWLWLSWYNGCFRYQRSAVRIQSLANFYIKHLLIVNCNEKTKMKKTRPGMAHLKNEWPPKSLWKKIRLFLLMRSSCWRVVVNVLSLFFDFPFIPFPSLPPIFVPHLLRLRPICFFFSDANNANLPFEMLHWLLHFNAWLDACRRDSPKRNNDDAVRMRWWRWCTLAEWRRRKENYIDSIFKSREIEQNSRLWCWS